mmetsp:Transcript_5224/g.7711  ORF Transcript_5224/g.7711 Transcript_5224/m.7711 type:complete len:879 (+) Transcript_5224:1031-3667(+)
MIASTNKNGQAKLVMPSPIKKQQEPNIENSPPSNNKNKRGKRKHTRTYSSKEHKSPNMYQRVRSRLYRLYNYRVKPTPKNTKYMTWSEYMNKVLNYRFMTIPFHMIMMQFFLQSINELISGVYGNYIIQLAKSTRARYYIEFDLIIVLLLSLGSPILIVLLGYPLSLVWQPANQWLTNQSKYHHSIVLSICSILSIVFRVFIPMGMRTDSYLNLLFASLSCGFALIYVTLFFGYGGLCLHTNGNDESLHMILGFVGGLLGVLFWKTIGSTVDYSMRGAYVQVIITIEACIACVYVCGIMYSHYWYEHYEDVEEQHEPPKLPSLLLHTPMATMNDPNKFFEQDVFNNSKDSTSMQASIKSMKNHELATLKNSNYTDLHAKGIYPQAVHEHAYESMETWRVFVIFFGLIGNFMLLFIICSTPAVFSRWVRGNYSATLTLQVLMIGIFSYFFVYRPKSVGFLRHRSILAANFLFFITLSTLNFRSQMENYRYVYGVQQGLVYMCIALTPIIFINILLLCHELLRKRRISIVTLAVASTFSVGVFGYLVILSTLTPFHQHLHAWLIKVPQHAAIMIIHLCSILPLLAVRLNSFIFFNDGVDDILQGDNRSNTTLKNITFSTIFCLIVGIMVVLLYSTPTAYYTSIPPKRSPHRVTYSMINTQCGYNIYGQKDFSAYLKQARSTHADMIGLLASDTSKLENGNSDLVRYLANSLSFYSYYGPKPTEGYVGISFLSRFPLRDWHTMMISSLKERTAIIYGDVLMSRTERSIVLLADMGRQDDHQLLMQKRLVALIHQLKSHHVKLTILLERRFYDDHKMKLFLTKLHALIRDNDDDRGWLVNQVSWNNKTIHFMLGNHGSVSSSTVIPQPSSFHQTVVTTIQHV